MPLIPQQDLVVITGPYQGAGTHYEQAVGKLRAVLEGYPPCRVISITCRGNMHDYTLTAVVETV